MTASRGIEAARAAQLTADRERIEAYIRRHEPVSREVVAAELGIDLAALSKRLRELRIAGRVALAGVTSTARWCVPYSDAYNAELQRLEARRAMQHRQKEKRRWARRVEAELSTFEQPPTRVIVSVDVAGVDVPPNAVPWVFALGDVRSRVSEAA